MPILRVTGDRAGAVLHGSDRPATVGLAAALEADPGPVTVMIHGYKYAPGHPVHCPHATLLSPMPRRQHWKIVSWPRRLGLRGQHGEGVGISFGWAARGSVWQAYDRAGRAGDALAELLAALRALDPDRPVRIIGHSMGARVALRAIARSAPGTVGRAVLLASAEYDATAADALRAPGGVDCAVLNVTSRENDLFDFLLERLITPETPSDRVMGLGRLRLPNLAHVQIDDGASLRVLARAGFPVAPPDKRICHWSPYLRPGLFPLYRAFLSGRLGVAQLRALLPEETAPRWSRLFPALPPLPMPRGAALR